MSTQRIVTNLWFDTQAEEAIAFYCSVFEDARVISVTPYPPGSDKAGAAMVVEFELLGQRFLAINGGPEFTFNEAISLAVGCQDQAEIDYYWEKLTADGGEEGPCGWCKDKFGLSWQVTPKGCLRLLGPLLGVIGGRMERRIWGGLKGYLEGRGGTSPG